MQTKLSAIGTAGAKKAIKIERPHLSAVDSSDSEQEREPAGVAPDAAKAWGAKRFAAKVVSEGVCSSVG